MFYLVVRGKALGVIEKDQIIFDKNNEILDIGDKIKFLHPKNSLLQKEIKGKIISIDGKLYF